MFWFRNNLNLVNNKKTLVNQRLSRSMGRKGYWGTLKKPIKIAFDTLKAVKK